MAVAATTHLQGSGSELGTVRERRRVRVVVPTRLGPVIFDCGIHPAKAQPNAPCRATALAWEERRGRDQVKECASFRSPAIPSS